MPFCTKCGASLSPDQAYCPVCGNTINSTAGSPAYQTSYSTGIDADASTARNLTLIALIVQGIFFIAGLFFSLFIFAFFGPFGALGLGFAGLVFAVLGVGFLISIVWMALDYLLVYRNLLSSATVVDARTPSIVLGIVQLISGGVIPGILMILAYFKICDSMRSRGQNY